MQTLKDQILKLKEEGHSYKSIVDTLGCSKGTVAYHLGAGQKEKTALRQKKNRATLNSKLTKKIKEFRRTTSNSISPDRKDRALSGTPFTPDQLLEKTGETCYLTGRAIDLMNTEEYSLDHIIPRAANGGNELTNCGLACRQANQAKASMSKEEFFQLCIDVVKHNKLSLD